MLNEWPSRTKQAKMRWEATKRRSEWLASERQRKDGNKEERTEKTEALSGGKLSSGETLPPMTLLNLAAYDALNWSKAAARKNKWTLPKLQNQLKLRNNRIESRSITLTEQLIAVGLIDKVGTRLITSGTFDEVVPRLKQVLEVEDKAIGMEQAANAAAAAAQLAQSRRRRAERQGRGTNRRHVPK